MVKDLRIEKSLKFYGRFLRLTKAISAHVHVTSGNPTSVPTQFRHRNRVASWWLALMANLLCRGRQKRTMRETEAQIENFG